MVAVIGDVHGCYFTLAELYQKIQFKYPEAEVYCVGDLIDRGNYSREVVDFIVDNKIKFTPGNHDYMFFHYFKKPDTIFAKSWYYNGNEATLNSYEEFPEKMNEHIEIIKSAPLFFDTADCFISHAGISGRYKNILSGNLDDYLPQLSKLIDEDYEKDIGVMWTRDELLNLGKAQIVGHTKSKELIISKNANAYYIDTGACSGNKLSCIIMNESKLVEILDETTHLNDIL